ncbi:hypothetical protein MTO96_022739 [Rhipicephalus appendiculatus]
MEGGVGFESWKGGCVVQSSERYPPPMESVSAPTPSREMAVDGLEPEEWSHDCPRVARSNASNPSRNVTNECFDYSND